MEKILNEEIDRLRGLMDIPNKNNYPLLTESRNKLINSFIDLFRRYTGDVVESEKIIKKMTVSSKLSQTAKAKIIKNSKKIIQDVDNGIENKIFNDLVAQISEEAAEKIIKEYINTYIEKSVKFKNSESEILFYILRKARKEGIEDVDAVIADYKNFLEKNKEKYKLSDDIIEVMIDRVTDHNFLIKFEQKDYKFLDQIKSKKYDINIFKKISLKMRPLYSFLEGLLSNQTPKDYLENQRKESIKLLESLVENPTRFISNEGKLDINTFNEVLKNNMEGMVNKNPSWKFLFTNGATVYDLKKIWEKIEKDIRLEGKNMGIEDKEINYLIEQIKSGGDDKRSIENFIDSYQKSMDITSEIFSPGWSRQTWPEIKKMLPNLKLDHNILKNVLKALASKQTLSLLTYGIYRTPLTIMRNMTRFGKSRKNIVLSLLRTYVELIFLKFVIIPLYGFLTALTVYLTEALGGDLDIPDDENLIDTTIREISEGYAESFSSLASTLIPFEKGVLYKLFMSINWKTNKDTVKTRVELLEREYNQTIGEEINSDQKKYINRVSSMDIDFRSAISALKTNYAINNLSKSDAKLLIDNISVVAKEITGTYDKVKDKLGDNDEFDLKDLEIDEPLFKKDEKSIAGLKYGIKDKLGVIYEIGVSQSSVDSQFYNQNDPINIVKFKDKDGKIKPIKDFLPKLKSIEKETPSQEKQTINQQKPVDVNSPKVEPKQTVTPIQNKQTVTPSPAPQVTGGEDINENTMIDLIKKLILEEEEEKTLKMKDWDEIFTFQKIDDKNPGKYTDVKIKMESVMDRMPHWRKKYKKLCDELENCDDDGEDDSFVRAVIDTHPEVVRILFTKGLAHLTSSEEQEDLNEGLHGLLAIIRESKSVEVEVWSVYRHPSSPDKIWSLVKGDFKPKELSSMDVKMQRSPGNTEEKKKDSLSELKKKESDAIELLLKDEKKGLLELPIKVRNKIKEKISKGWTTEEPPKELKKFYKEDNVNTIFAEDIVIYKLKPNESFFNFIQDKDLKDNIKRGFCRAIYYVEKEFDLPKEKMEKINEILDECEEKLDGKYGQNYL
jgi:hypothetical protein